MELINNLRLKPMCLFKISLVARLQFWTGLRFCNFYSQARSDWLSDSQVLGFGEYIEEVYAAYEQHKLETMVIFIFPHPFSFSARKIIFKIRSLHMTKPCIKMVQLVQHLPCFYLLLPQWIGVMSFIEPSGFCFCTFPVLV